MSPAAPVDDYDEAMSVLNAGSYDGDGREFRTERTIVIDHPAGRTYRHFTIRAVTDGADQPAADGKPGRAHALRNRAHLRLVEPVDCTLEHVGAIGQHPTDAPFDRTREAQHAVVVAGGERNWLTHIFGRNVWGDVLALTDGVAKTAALGVLVDGVARHGISSTSNVDCTVGWVHQIGRVGRSIIDVEPLGSTMKVIRFQIYIVGIRAAYGNSAVGIGGSGTVDGVGAYGVHSFGVPLTNKVGSDGRRTRNVHFANWASDTPANGPLLDFEHVDGLTLTDMGGLAVVPYEAGNKPGTVRSTGERWTLVDCTDVEAA